MKNSTQKTISNGKNNQKGKKNCAKAKKNIRLTVSFDISKKEDMDLLAKLRQLATTEGSGVTLLTENGFFLKARG